LKSAAADVLPSDGKLSLKEWFDYAVIRVPQLRAADFDKTSQNESKKGVRESIGNSDSKEKDRLPKPQSPRAFYRRQIESQPMIIASVGSLSKK